MAVLKPTEGSSYEEVPDVIPPIAAGIYTLECVDVDVKPNKEKNGNNLVCTWKVVDAADDAMNGRKTTSYTAVRQDTMIKRIFTSAGIKPAADGGYDTDWLKGARVRATIAPEAYTDPATGQQRESSRIKEFLIPSDAGFEP